MRSRGLSSPDRADAIIGTAMMSLPGFTGSITMDILAGMQFGRCLDPTMLFLPSSKIPPSWTVGIDISLSAWLATRNVELRGWGW
jgi:hypothetical protein